MVSKTALSIILLFLCILLPFVSAVSETKILDSTTHAIAQNIWSNNFPDVLKSAEQIIASEPANPVGYFLLGAVYQIISEEYRNDSYQVEIEDNLEQAINLCNQKKDTDPRNPDWYFISGAAYGYRGLHRAFHGRWWKAFTDGFKCRSNLKKALELDSTYYDACWGLGSYYYYRTIKSRDFLWLPFISDKREEGMALIRKAIASGFLSSNIARESFLRIYLIEEKLEELVSLADSLCQIWPADPYFLLFHTEGLLALGRLDEAEEKLQQLKLAWKNSPYYDPAGAYEAELLFARIAYRRGDAVTADKILEHILSQKKLKKSNAYFGETYDRARDFARNRR